MAREKARLDNEQINLLNLLTSKKHYVNTLEFKKGCANPCRQMSLYCSLLEGLFLEAAKANDWNMTNINKSMHFYHLVQLGSAGLRAQRYIVNYLVRKGASGWVMEYLKRLFEFNLCKPRHHLNFVWRLGLFSCNYVDFSRIWTRIVRVEGEHVDL